MSFFVPAVKGKHRVSVAGRGPRVGLLGGSFNPAHAGHLHISRLAFKRLRLAEVWWLVAPQNPLKPADDMAPLTERLTNARAVAGSAAWGQRVRVTDMEREMGTRYTADTLKALKRRFPAHRFVWIMGADNLIEIPRWHGWTTVFDAVPVAVFARPTYSFRALTSKAARRFARYRIKEVRATALADMRPPAWVFVHIPLNAASATGIRAGTRNRK